MIGGSPISSSGKGAIIWIVPDAPVNLVNLPAITSAYQVGLSWQQGASTGGTAITEYVLSYDQGFNTYVVFERGITSTGYIATNLKPGIRYTFKV